LRRVGPNIRFDSSLAFQARLLAVLLSVCVADAVNQAETRLQPTDTFSVVALVRFGARGSVVTGTAVGQFNNDAKAGLRLAHGSQARLQARKGTIHNGGRVDDTLLVLALQGPVAEVAVLELAAVRIGVALAGRIKLAHAQAILAMVVDGARVAVGAGACFVLVDATGIGIAVVRGAVVHVVAIHRKTLADPARAVIQLGAEVQVVAGGAVQHVADLALSGGRAAKGLAALVGGLAGNHCFFVQQALALEALKRAVAQVAVLELVAIVAGRTADAIRDRIGGTDSALAMVTRGTSISVVTRAVCRHRVALVVLSAEVLRARICVVAITAVALAVTAGYPAFLVLTPVLLAQGFAAAVIDALVAFQAFAATTATAVIAAIPTVAGSGVVATQALVAHKTHAAHYSVGHQSPDGGVHCRVTDPAAIERIICAIRQARPVDEAEGRLRRQIDGIRPGRRGVGLEPNIPDLPDIS